MSNDITSLKRSLANDAQRVCEKLLPDGKRIGHEWVHDPGSGKIKVQLNGSKAGVWSWFGGDDDGGDLIDLWRHVSGRPMKEVLDEVRDYLGVEKPNFLTGTKREFKKPTKPKGRLVQNKSKAHMYLTEERNISEQSLADYLIAETTDGNSIVFPYLVERGDLRLCKVREAEDGKRPIPTMADCERILMGWHLVTDDDRAMCIVEGELDAPSGHDYKLGFPVLSVPFGGGGGNKQAWVENDFERLAQFETIYLALDDDEEGDRAAEEIAKRVGRHRCLRVRLPKKDFNDCLMSGVTRDQIVAAFDNAEDLRPGGLHTADVYRHDIHELFHPTEGAHIGYSNPWSKIGSKLLYRPGEVTIWSGMSGSGKSQLLGECQLHWINEGSCIVLASLEMHPRQSLRRMIKQCGGTESPTAMYIDKIINWIDGENHNSGRLLIYDLVGKIKLQELLDVFTYARMKYGADQFVIDSLMRLGLQTDDYNGQEGLMVDLVNWAQEHDVHVHLVAHNRKSEAGQGQHQGLEGIKGAMEVGANAFNQVEVIRNRKVEEIKAKHDDGKELSEKEEKLLGAPGVVFACNKQRNGDWEGKVGLWFYQEQYQYWDHERGAAETKTYFHDLEGASNGQDDII